MSESLFTNHLKMSAIVYIVSPNWWLGRLHQRLDKFNEYLAWSGLWVTLIRTIKLEYYELRFDGRKTCQLAAVATLSWGAWEGLACGPFLMPIKACGETISTHGLVKTVFQKKIKDKATGTGSYKTEIRNQDFFTIEVITSWSDHANVLEHVQLVPLWPGHKS